MPSRPLGQSEASSSPLVVPPRFVSAHDLIHNPSSNSWSGVQVGNLSQSEVNYGFYVDSIQANWVLPNVAFYVPSNAGPAPTPEAEDQYQSLSMWVGLSDENATLAAGFDIILQYTPYAPYQGSPLPAGWSKTLYAFVELWSEEVGILMSGVLPPLDSQTVSVGDWVHVHLLYESEPSGGGEYYLGISNRTQDYRYDYFPVSSALGQPIPRIAAKHGEWVVEIPQTGLVYEPLDVFWPSFPTYGEVVFDQSRCTFAYLGLESYPFELSALDGSAHSMGDGKAVYSRARALNKACVKCWDFDVTPDVARSLAEVVPYTATRHAGGLPISIVRNTPPWPPSIQGPGG